MGCLHHHSLRGYSLLHYSLSRRLSSRKKPRIQDQEVYQSQKKQKINHPFVSIDVNPDPVKEIPLFPHSTPPVPNTRPQSTPRPYPPPPPRRPPTRTPQPSRPPPQPSHTNILPPHRPANPIPQILSPRSHHRPLRLWPPF